ncbi:YfcC family protein [Denitrobaculum tricleocarpae]|uniref:YfcC family protein n=1 Tax=Denitrobaculum tricleocarpae TaxID=2591009 RepID=A0A545TMR1_9PROT|nr:YfcC family protein [Denitrobaculum tricleocarpae]TQV78519.1 YfcC family protein [Denitrobaculum tricleocarpae]
MKLKFPSAYTILFGLIIAVAVATWFVPAGQYDREMSETLGKEVPIPGTYKTVEPNPQGFSDVVLAPIAGFFDPGTYEARAVDVALFVLIIGGFLGIVTRTGAIDAGIERAMAAMRGREKWMIPILMALFAAGGTVYGMAEETLAFYGLIIPVMIAARYDAVTGVAIIMLGAGVGTLGSTINPFATVIAANAAGIAFTDGILLRFVLLILCWLACVVYVMRYAEKVKANPSASIVADRRESNEAHFLKGREAAAGNHQLDFTLTRKIVLLVFVLAFAVMIWGVSAGGWWMAEMSGLFIVAAILVGVIARMSEEDFTNTFVDGARDLLGVALVIGIARGIVVVMDAGNMTDTILFWAEGAVSGLPAIAFINSMFGIEVALSFFVPSSSGLAVLTMPIMAPLADFAAVPRDLVVTAYQSASGLVNLINPTFAVVMGGLALGRVPYERWLRFMWPLLLILTVIIMAAISIATLLN